MGGGGIRQAFCVWLIETGLNSAGCFEKGGGGDRKLVFPSFFFKQRFYGVCSHRPALCLLQNENNHFFSKVFRGVPDNGLMTPDDKRYFIKYGLCLAMAHLSLTALALSLFFEWRISRLDNSNKALKKTVQRMEQVDDRFQSILKMERMKVDYENKGIKATED